jgi:hypothetical protein
MDLVTTYEAERRGVAQRITSQSLQNSINVQLIGAAAASGAQGPLTAEQVVAESRRYGNHLGVEFGAVYQSSAVIADGTAPPDVADGYSDYAPSATPGARAPHVWLGCPEARLSTLDLFGSGFALLAGPGGGAWCTVAAEVQRQLGVPIDRYRIGRPACTMPVASPKRTGSARTVPCWSDPTATLHGAAPADRRAMRCCATPSGGSSLRIL